MKKLEQITMNNNAKTIWEHALYDFSAKPDYIPERLRNCQAYVYDCGEYYILRSYSTLVAAVAKHNGLAVDMLRYEYGYTATTAQHVNKFFKDYGANPNNTLTYRHV